MESRSHIDLSRMVIFPDGRDPEIYHGSITIHNETFETRFSNPMYFQSEEKKQNIICELDGQLSQILYHCKPTIHKKLCQSQTPEQFINELYNILHKTLDTASIPQTISSSFYAKICRELDVIGWQCITQISSDMTQFIINTKPNKRNTSRKYELYFKIVDPNNFPNSKPLIIANSLPSAFEYEWSTVQKEHCDEEHDEIMENMDQKQQPTVVQSKYNHIGNVIKQYNMECIKYKLFWKIMDDFYENAIVLEPLKINYGSNTLRILLDKVKKTTVEIKLNPDPLTCQTMKCQCKFYGIKDEIAILKQKWNDDEDSGEIWDADVLPRINIQQIVEIRFITDDDDNNNDTIDIIISEMECSMCLEFKNDDDNTIPNVVCKSCKKSFHQSCLMEWFESLGTINHHYTSIEGKCPQCAQTMSFALNE